MRNRIFLIVLIVVSLLCASFAYQAQSKPTYEYKYETSPSEKKTNDLASQGWELVAVESAGAGRIAPTYIFKRAK